MPEDKLSFIPQKTIEPFFYKRRGLGIFAVFFFLIFLVSLLLYGGMFVYKNNLKKEVNNLAASLERAKAAFEISLINELNQLANKINVTKKLLETHITPAPLFDFLEKNTLKDIRFKSFKYSVDNSGNLIVLLEGVAKDYSSLALQGDVFEKEENIKEVSFSGLSLSDQGLVNFNVKLSLAPSFITYQTGE